MNQNIIALHMIVEEAGNAQVDIIRTFKQLKEATGGRIAYIAGKVTGLPYDDVYFKFKVRQESLLRAGYIVINPCEVLDFNTDWNDAMKICLTLLTYADGISLLHDWQDSKGATMEKELADQLGIAPIVLSEKYNLINQL